MVLGLQKGRGEGSGITSVSDREEVGREITTGGRIFSDKMEAGPFIR